ncbi:MAG: alanine--tRNA ligase [Anaerolineaceae bacterium]|nr:alanine--tRNA ligase [Anaerolineaceae bacterium]
MEKPSTGAEIRQSFIDFFKGKGHTFVPSSSLVPGGDQTLLFTNAGMVQFKDVFLGIDHRPYTRAVNSQKCMRVAGKHNDLDDVGRDDSHHTFFEMLGNWSFGDYYKKEAIAWAWELLTDVWGLNPALLCTTCFKDEKEEIPTDDEAAENWKQQPGIIQDHVLYSGRKDNFWEMADTGPCGPCSEIHIDLGPVFCNKQGVAGHVCKVNGDCIRFLELWNLVFIQYNRLSPTVLEPLPARHVDTGMGFDRIVSVLQGVYSNYRTDLLFPLIATVQKLTGQTDVEREANLTPYRVLADHGRAAAFLIADGVVPGNTGRNYVCRMIIRRAARFGSKIGLDEPFLAKLAETVIEVYGKAYPELERNRSAILTSLTREETRFKRTVEAGISHLEELLDEVGAGKGAILGGEKAFDLYATHGLPLEISRDIAREKGLDVDEKGFKKAMEEHRLISGAGKAFGPLGGEDVEIYRPILEDLIHRGVVDAAGVAYNPYEWLKIHTQISALIFEGIPVSEAHTGDVVEVILPQTGFYVESGGQISDTGSIAAEDNSWEIKVLDMRRPAAGVIVHVGEVVRGMPHTGDSVIAAVDAYRRQDIMRNHTATHLLHAELRTVLGDQVRQAGSLVSPDRLRFDFTHSEALTFEQIEVIEAGVNKAILDDYDLTISSKPLKVAISEGAMALFGEKYGDTVRTITIGDEDVFSYELCGGTHVNETGELGAFLITSEGSAAAGVRRIEAITGRAAFALIQKRLRTIKHVSHLLGSSPDDLESKTQQLLEDYDQSRKLVAQLRQGAAVQKFGEMLENVSLVKDIPTLATMLPDTEVDMLRELCDRFRQHYKSGVVVLGSVVRGRPIIVTAVTDDLVKRGVHAGELAKRTALIIEGSGGGKPNLAQAGGKDASKLPEAILQVPKIVEELIA